MARRAITAITSIVKTITQSYRRSAINTISKRSAQVAACSTADTR
jgi:hypothetical protein